MSLKQILRPTNRRIRLAVGLLLLGLFFMQCTRTEATRAPSLVTIVDGKAVGQNSDQQMAHFEQLAKTDHVTLLKECLDHYRATYHNYTCTFIKQERIDQELRPQQWTDVKFKQEPFSVLMQWTKNDAGAKTMLYVAGKYDNKMLIKPSGLAAIAGTVSRGPEDPQVLANTLRPVTKFGFENMINSLLSVYELANQRGECKIAFDGYRQIEGRSVMALRRELPARKDYPAKTTVWYFDPQYQLPIGMEAKDWSDEMMCSYTYKDVRFNIDLTDDDFTPDANGMKWKK